MFKTLKTIMRNISDKEYDMPDFDLNHWFE